MIYSKEEYQELVNFAEEGLIPAEIVWIGDKAIYEVVLTTEQYINSSKDMQDYDDKLLLARDRIKELEGEKECYEQKLDDDRKEITNLANKALTNLANNGSRRKITFPFLPKVNMIKGWFLSWTVENDGAADYSYTKAIVEVESGEVLLIPADEITFKEWSE